MIRHKKQKIKIYFLVALLAVVAAVLFRENAARRSRPNIIFLMCDSLRADHMSCYGYHRATTPFLDGFARTGLVFTQAISQASWTSPSMCALLTGQYPDHRLQETGYALSDDNEHLLKILKRQGYRTAFFTNNVPITDITLDAVKGSFDTYMSENVPAPLVIDRALSWLVRKKDGPYFLWIFLSEPHSPYTPPKEYFTPFLSDPFAVHQDLPIIEDKERNEFYSFGGIPRYVAEPGATDAAYYIAKYDGEIRYADEQLGRFLGSLKRSPAGDNTFIAVFADHGESLTEHGFYFNHSHYLFENLIRVPLIIHLPGPLPRAAVIPRQVQMIDLFPTVLEVAGIKKPADIEGKSLLPLVKGKVARLHDYTFSESGYWPHSRCVRTEQWKLIHHRLRDAFELYDLKNDPEELKNLYGKYPAQEAELKEKLTDWAQSAATHKVATTGTTDEQKEKLSSLGYVQ